MAAKVLPDWKGSGSGIGSRVATYGKLPHTGEELDESTVRECGTNDDLGGRNTVGLHCGGISSGRIVRASDVQLIKLRMNVVNANAERPRGPGSALKKCQLIWHTFSTLLRGPRVACDVQSAMAGRESRSRLRGVRSCAEGNGKTYAVERVTD